MGSGLESERMGFIGGGNMATALMRGLLNANIVTATQLRVGEPSDAQRKDSRSSPG